MNTLKKLKGFLLILAIFALGQFVSAEESFEPTEVKSFIDQQMQKDLENFHNPGAVISIVKDGQLIYSNGYGMADIEDDIPVTSESMFRIASTTKLFTWTAVMQLVEQGKIDLDTDINQYLTSLTIPDTFKNPITMRHLMTHTAGFEEGGVGYQLTTDEKRLNTTIAETLKKHPLARIRAAGKSASYSNYGAALAGLIIEDVSGLSYDEYIQTNIFNRLNMNNTTVVEPLPEKYQANKVIGYNYEDNQFVPGIPTYEGGFSPAGAATVSGDDMAKFMLAHLNNNSDNPLLKSETLQLMHKTAFRFDKRLPGSTLGFQEGEINGYQTLSHAGADTMFITDLYLIPEQNTGIFLSYSGGQADEALAAMKTAFFDHYFPSKEKVIPAFIETNEKELAQYTGSYKFTRRNSSHIDNFFSLLVEMTITQENGQLAIGQGVEKEFFKKIDTNLFQQVDGQQKIAFKTNSSGKTTEMLLSIMPDMPLEKTAFWDQSLVWLVLLAAALVIFIFTIIIILFNLKKIKKLAKNNKNTVWVLLATSISAIITLILLVTTVLNMDVLQRLSEISLSLKLFLFLPLLVAELTVVLLVKTGIAWFKKQFSLPVRLFLTIGLGAAIIVSLFFFHWNLIGWHFG